MANELKQYIDRALLAGQNKEAIAKTLVSAGWQSDMIAKTLQDIAGVDSANIPIPKPKQAAYHLARDLFLYGLGVLLLCFILSAYFMVAHNVIDMLMPDVLRGNTVGGFNLEWPIAQLVVALPVFAWLYNTVAKELAAQPEKRQGVVRKLFIHFSLFINAMVALIGLMVLIGQVLKGDISGNALLKIMNVLVVASAMFGLFFGELKRDEQLVGSTP